MRWKSLARDEGELPVLQWDHDKTATYLVARQGGGGGRGKAIRNAPAAATILGNFVLTEPGTRTNSLGTYEGLIAACNACARSAQQKEDRHDWEIPKGWHLTETDGRADMEEGPRMTPAQREALEAQRNCRNAEPPPA